MATPFVTFFIATYNQEAFIADAVKGALAQDYPNMEIIISDDCSSDNTWSTIQDTLAEYTGDKLIRLNRNERNLGIREHINKVLYELAKGDIIVFAAGDDVSLPNRTSVSVAFLEKHPEVSSLSFASRWVNDNLKPFAQEPVFTLSDGRDSIITLEDYVLYDYFIFSGDSRVIRRKVIDSFPRLSYPDSEDIYIFLRSLYIGSVAYIRQPLVLYRHYAGNYSRNHTSTDTVFSQTVEKQIWEDLDYAIAQGYIQDFQKDCIARRLKWVIGILHSRIVGETPEKRSLLYRIARAIKREISASLKQKYKDGR